MADANAGLGEVDIGDSTEECNRAADVVLDVALENCGPGAVTGPIARMVGLKTDFDEAVADAPDDLDTGDCMNVPRVRAWIAKRALDLYSNGEEGMIGAVERARNEADVICGWE